MKALRKDAYDGASADVLLLLKNERAASGRRTFKETYGD